ncbi:MAG: hypothetical protein ABMB14_21005 [Myxococcota bacterium]
MNATGPAGLGASLRQGWGDWVSFWDEREKPISLALVRILLGLCWFYDFFHIWRLGLVVPLFGVGEVGGFSDALMRDHTPLFYQLFPGTELSARGLHAAITLSALCLMLGFFSRISAFTLLVGWATFAEVLPYADRGIDTLSRLALCVLVCSGSGKTLSIDAYIRTGSVWGDGSTILCAPRRLLVLQLVLMYFAAGVSKVGITWWPMGHFAALYFALQDPAVAAWDFSYLRNQPFFFFTQIGTAGTILYQTTYPLVLLLMWWRRNPGRGGRIARFATKYRLEWVWIGIGGVFHSALAVSMNLGIFPWAMLALYPVWVTPDEFEAIGRKLRAWFTRSVASPQS